jgi:hypothetical protein
VWVVDREQGAEKGVARQRHVMTGTRRMNGWVEVEEGLRPGDLLIGTERERMSEGKRVRVVGEVALP